MNNRKILAVILVLALIGVADSSYALFQHYAPANTSSCDVNETISCTAINQSEYSVLFAVPVAALGIAGYIFMAALPSTMLLRLIGQELALLLLLAVSLVATGFSLWLSYIEIFILRALCPLCVTSQTLVAAITVLALTAVLRRRHNRPAIL